MKRALLVTTGTVAGLVSVLAYSPLDPATTVLAGNGGPGPGLGAPTESTPSAGPAAPDGASASAALPATARTVHPAPRSARSTTRRVPVVARARRTTASPSASPSATLMSPPTRRGPSSTAATPPRVVTRRSSSPPRTSSAPRPTPSPTRSASPTPTPTPAGPRDYTGSAITYRYGTLQVAIRVVSGRITDAWAVTYPTGDSLPYSNMAIPILRSQTISAQSAHISGATGASLTSASWITSLSSALSAAGLR